MIRSVRARPSRRSAALLGAAVFALTACSSGPAPDWQFTTVGSAEGAAASASTQGGSAGSGSSELVSPAASGAPPASAVPSAVASAATADPGSGTTTGSTGSGDAGGASAPAAASVSIVDFAFQPARITVRAGGRVTFRNDASTPHTVKFGTSESPFLMAGQSHTQAFPAAGTFAYLCGLHPEMKGDVVVVGAGGGTGGTGSTGGGGSAATPTPAPTSTPNSPAATPASPAPTTPSTPSAPGAAAPGSVRILDGAFSPSSLTVAVGAAVTWTNTDDSRHTVRFGNSESPILEGGQTFRRSFPTTGTFSYVCGLHSDMTGRIVVTASSGGGGGGGGGGGTTTPAPAPTSDPTSVVLARIEAYQDLLGQAAGQGLYEDRADNLADLASRVAAEVGEGDIDGARSKAADLVEDTADAVEDDGMTTMGRRMIDAARAVQGAVAAI